jgi:hypothetical protein
MFVPIHFGFNNHPSNAVMNTSGYAKLPKHLTPRPHTAPSSAEIYRPSSALDTPELSQDNLRTMLK